MLRTVELTKITGNGGLQVSFNLPVGILRAIRIPEALAALVIANITQFLFQVNGDNRVNMSGPDIDAWNARFNRRLFTTGGANLLEWQFQETAAKSAALQRSVCPVINGETAGLLTISLAVAATFRVFVDYDDDLNADSGKYVIRRVLRYSDQLGAGTVAQPTYTLAVPCGTAGDSPTDQNTWVRVWATPSAGAITQMAIGSFDQNALYNRLTANNVWAHANYGYAAIAAGSDLFDGIESGDVKPLKLSDKGYGGSKNCPIYFVNALAATYNIILDSYGAK